MSRSSDFEDDRKSAISEISDPEEGDDEEWDKMTEEEREVQRQQLREIRRIRREHNEEARRICTDPNLSFVEKIDQLGKHRHWYRNDMEPTISVIESYLTGSLSKDAAAEELAAPIDHLWTTADEGRAYHSCEKVARNQRQYQTPEKALELWGPEQDWPEPSEPFDHPKSTEGRLWDLWYAFLQIARRTNWASPNQTKLTELMGALRSRPNPPLPDPMTIPLRQDWVWEEGVLWSTMVILSAATRESWNHQPGYGTGWTDTEMQANANFNAFLARVTVGLVYDFRQYGFYAFAYLMEDEVGEGGHQPADYATKMESYAMTALVWARLAGKYLWDRRGDDKPGYEDVSLNARGEDLPWVGNENWAEVSPARMRFWLGRLEEICNDARLSTTTKDNCLEITRILEELAQNADGERIKDRPLISGWVALTEEVAEVQD